MWIRKLMAIGIAALGLGLVAFSGVAWSDQPAKKPSITGRITYDGSAPPRKKVSIGGNHNCSAIHKDGLVEDESLIVSDAGAIKDVVIFVSKNAPSGRPVPPPAMMDQKNCRFEPHVLVMMVGQELHVGNHDGFLHNVHGISEDNPAFNFGQSGATAPKKVCTVRAAEQFFIKCDVHPWMNCRVHVFEHPFAAVSDAEGNFAICDLPPGKYTITTQHPKLGEATADVIVEAGKPPVIDLKLKLTEE